jgi:hypothetical protein
MSPDGGLAIAASDAEVSVGGATVANRYDRLAAASEPPRSQPVAASGKDEPKPAVFGRSLGNDPSSIVDHGYEAINLSADHPYRSPSETDVPHEDSARLSHVGSHVTVPSHTRATGRDQRDCENRQKRARCSAHLNDGTTPSGLCHALRSHQHSAARAHPLT